MNGQGGAGANCGLTNPGCTVTGCWDVSIVAI
jgi:hypothetical protein